MKVKQLIEELRKMPEDLEAVFIDKNKKWTSLSKVFLDQEGDCRVVAIEPFRFKGLLDPGGLLHGKGYTLDDFRKAGHYVYDSTDEKQVEYVKKNFDKLCRDNRIREMINKKFKKACLESGLEVEELKVGWRIKDE